MMRYHEILNEHRFFEGEVVRFPKPSRRATDNNDICNAAKSLRDFLSDPRPVHQRYQPGDVLRSRKIGEIVDVDEIVQSGDDPILAVTVRSNGHKTRFFASDLYPAPIEFW